MNRDLHTKTLACLTAAGILLSFAACSGAPGAQQASAPAEEETAVMVKTQPPQTGELVQTTDYIGTIEPDSLVEVMPKMSGTVSKVYAKVGDTVKAGDLLMEFETTDIEVSLSAQWASVEVARAAVMTAQAQVDQSLGSTFDVQLAQLETQVQSAKNQYASARQGLRDYNDSVDSSRDRLISQRDSLRDNVPLMQDQLARLKVIEQDAKKALDADPQNTALKDDYDAARTERIALEAKVESAEDSLSMLNANVNDDDSDDAQARSLRTASKNAQLAYDSANTIYELTKNDVRNDALKVANANLGQAAANFDAQVKGYESAAHQLTFAKVYSPIDGVVEACNVTENAMAGSSSPVFTVSNKSDIVVIFYVSEDAAKQFQLGDKVTVENGGKKMDASITEIGSMVDSTGLFKVKASLGEQSSLLSGISVKVMASTAKSQGFLLPQSAIYYEEGKPYVYVAKDGKAVKAFIELGVTNNDQAEVTSGVEADDQVITTWNPNLRDGAKIDAAPADGESSSSAPDAASSDTDASSASSAGSAQEEPEK